MNRSRRRRTPDGGIPPFHIHNHTKPANAMNEVHAVIELKITPQRDCGFGKIAERVAKFEQVEACFLMSGGYDLLVFVKGESLQDVAHFVAADISTLEGVLSTATHFMLKTYKAKGVLEALGTDERLAVTP